jgi:tetratricopeptide (TPR) repeat protein
MWTTMLYSLFGRLTVKTFLLTLLLTCVLGLPALALPETVVQAEGLLIEDPARTITLIEKEYGTEPDHGYAAALLAWARLLVDRDDELGLERFRALVQRFPEEGSAHLLLGASLAESSPEEALDFARKGLELGIPTPMMAEFSVFILQELEDYDAALLAAEKWQDMVQGSAESIGFFYPIFRVVKDFDESSKYRVRAGRLILKTLKAYPPEVASEDQSKYLEGTGACYNLIPQEMSEIVPLITSREWDDTLTVAVVLIEMGAAEPALEFLDGGLKDNPNSDRLGYHRARALVRLGRDEEALQQLSELPDFSPEDARDPLLKALLKQR